MKAERPQMNVSITPVTRKVVAIIHMASEVHLGFKILPMLRLLTVF
jgi:hypothetical protein